MNNKRATKRALLTSVTALVMCVVMLAGTTFAWFTDTASTGVNKIQAGNLDVALEYATKWDNNGNVTKWENAEGKTLQFKKAAGAPADEQVLWEPGCRYQLPELRVVNNGNLALKYIIKVTGIETNHEVVPGEPNLKDVIDWTIKYGTNKVEDNTSDIPVVTGYSLNPGASDVVTIKGEMDKNAGNEYQGLSIDGVSVTVYATQMTAEFDSIDNLYDKDAAYKGSQEFTSGTHVLNKGGVALNPHDVAVLVSGAGTDVTITGGYYDGGKGGNNQCVHVRDGATVTIKGGTFTVGADANGYGNSVIESFGGNIVIEGGFFYTDYAYSNFYYVLNQNNNNPGTITVKGGTFVNYDPSKGDDHLGGNFVAEGYDVITETKANGDKWFTVVKGTGVTAGTQEALKDALANADTTGSDALTVKLADGEYTLYNVDRAKTQNTELTIEGAGKDKTTMSAYNPEPAAGEANADYSYENSDVTFKNITVNLGTGDWRGIVRAKSLYFENCIIEGRGSYWGTGTVVFKNCTFASVENDYNMWAYAGMDFTFENCTFNSDAGKFINAYKTQHTNTTKLTFTDCKFVAGTENKPAVCLKGYESNAWDVTFSGCSLTNCKTDATTGSNYYLLDQGIENATTVTIDGKVVWENGAKK